MAIDPKQPKPLHYALVMDERRNSILAALFEAAAHSNDGRMLFNAVLQQEGITSQEVTEFASDFSDREHELGWCKSTQCKRIQKT